MNHHSPTDEFHNSMCPSCLEPLDIHAGKICRSCGFIVHARCHVEDGGLCRACLMAGKACRQEGCIAYSRGLCLADHCRGPVEVAFLEGRLGFIMATYTRREKLLLYNRVSRLLFGSPDGAGRIADRRHDCGNRDCLAYEKSVCIASQCFGEVLMHRGLSLNIRATVYDDFVLRKAAIRKPEENTYQVKCRSCGDTVHCSGDAARHFLAMNRKPLCAYCRKQKGIC